MPAFSPAAQFLGATTPLASAATDTPVLVFGPGWGKLFIYHYIAGYSASQIALIRLGTATTVDTGSNYTAIGTHFTGTTATTTVTAATTGIKVANDATANGRRGLHEVWNPSGFPKMIDARTVTFSATDPTTSAATQSSQSLVTGHWWNNTQAQCVNMNSGGAGTLRAGSYITVYGIPGAG
jgi:hypothetical protein